MLNKNNDIFCDDMYDEDEHSKAIPTLFLLEALI